MVRDASTTRRIFSRRRLALAALASVSLHLLLAKGLAVTRLGERVVASKDAPKQAAPKRSAEFPLSVSRARRSQQAHERPLRVQLAPPTPSPRPQSSRPTTGLSERSDEAPAESVQSSGPDAPRPPAASVESFGAGASAERQARVVVETPAATVDTAAIGPGGVATSTAVPSPAAATGRSGPGSVAAAVRWVPREVALLERLAAGPAAPVTRPDAADDGPGRASAAPGRSTVVPDAAAAVAAVESVATAPASSAESPRVPAAARLRPAGSAGLAGATARRPQADLGEEPVQPGTHSRRDSGASRRMVADVPSASAIGLATEPRAAATAATAGRLARTPLGSPGDMAGSGLVPVIPPSVGEPRVGGSAGPMTPAAIGRLADRAGRPSPAAVTRARDRSADAAGDEGLSVIVGEAAGGLAAIAGREASPEVAPHLRPTAPDRVAAVVLPVEGRVRDVSEAFAGRSLGRKGITRRTTPEDVRAMALIDSGLDFLVRSQQEDGRWSLGRFAGSVVGDAPRLESDTAATGLALLSFLGAGYDHFDGPHRDVVRRGLEFLLSRQKANGDLYQPADELSNSCSWLYSHGIAAMALCEAVGMTGDPLVRPAAEKACNFIAASQHPTRGGWRYTPRSDADLSVSGWMLVALRSGQLAGMNTDQRTLRGVRVLLDAAALPNDAARYAYNPLKPDQRGSPLSSACMTAVGALMRLHTGVSPEDPRIVAAAQVLASMPPEYGAPAHKTRDCYLWYYASQVLVHTGGTPWRSWYSRLVEALGTTQEVSGPARGSWDPLGASPDRWGVYGGRVYVTALHLLALEVPDRHLPTYAAPTGNAAPR